MRLDGGVDGAEGGAGGEDLGGCDCGYGLGSCLFRCGGGWGRVLSLLLMLFLGLQVEVDGSVEYDKTSSVNVDAGVGNACKHDTVFGQVFAKGFALLIRCAGDEVFECSFGLVLGDE